MKPHTQAKNDRIMLGLAISRMSLKPGESRTCWDLACFTGLTPQAISLIEHRGLRKIRLELARQGIRCR